MDRVLDTACVWTNAAYIIAGAAVAPVNAAGGIALMLLGVLSGLWHVSGSHPALIGDRYGMYLVAIVLMTHVGMLPEAAYWAAPLAALPLALWVNSYTGVPPLIALSVGYRWDVLQIGALTLLVASICNLIALPHEPRHSRLYEVLHGLWHLLTAAAFVIMFHQTA